MWVFKKWQKITLLFLLAIAATVSTLQGINNALRYSQDFQWSPSVLFWEGVNPYAYYMNGNENDRIILSQAPNYAHFTYLALLPFSLLNWEDAKFAWALTTLLLGVLAVRILCKQARLELNETLIILFVFLCSTPFRNTVGNGQHAVVVLISFCAFFLQRKSLGESLVGIGFFKYSFMPPVFLYFVFDRGFKSAIFLSLSCVIGWLLFSLYLDTSPLSTLTQPLRVSHNSVENGTADIMTIVSFIYPSKELLLDRIFVYSAPVLLSLAFAFFVTKTTGSVLYKFAMLTIACLVTFKHLGYDFVLLLPAFVYAFKYRATIQAKIAIGLISFNWFGLKLIAPLNIVPQLLIVVNFLSIMALAFFIRIINKESNQ